MADSLYEASAARHGHLCPRQVLGVRMGLLAGQLLGIQVPQSGKRLWAVVETDGCFVDGIEVATHCRIGRRTLRIEDYGKVAATFIDSSSAAAIRLHPSPQARRLAAEYAPSAPDRWQAYLHGYRSMPDHLLFMSQAVSLSQPIESLLSTPEARAICDACGEEIINQREVFVAGKPYCRPCAGEGCHQVLAPEHQMSIASPQPFRPASLVADR